MFLRVEGEHLRAVKDFSAAIEREPQSHVLLLNRFKSLIKLSHFAEAKRDIDTLATLIGEEAVEPLRQLWEKAKRRGLNRGGEGGALLDSR
jgi:hypothetical protein